MRARINQIGLRGTTRQCAFLPGLNIIHGDAGSGKSSLVELIQSLFGAALDKVVPEVKHAVTHIDGIIEIGETAYHVVRPMSSSSTAKVEVAGPNDAHRLPAHSPDATSDLTYGQWLLARFGLPQIEVSLSERRLDAQVSPVTINDYFLYCHLKWNEIDQSVLGSSDPFKNRKRMVVFRILYGLYDSELAGLELHFRHSQLALAELRHRAQVLERALSGTALANRADLQHQLAVAESQLAQASVADKQRVDEPSSRTFEPRQASLRERVLQLDERVAALSTAIRDEHGSTEQLAALQDQLRSQSKRLTRAIVAGQQLVDFDFVRCPRCDSPIEPSRADKDQCYLCLQHPRPVTTSIELEKEQARLDKQLTETVELIGLHRKAASDLETALAVARSDRAQAGAELEEAARSYVTDSTEALVTGATNRARSMAEVARLAELLQILDRLEGASSQIGHAEQELSDLDAQLKEARRKKNAIEDRFKFLDKRIEQLLDQFDAPRSQERTKAYVDRETFLPVVDGRPFENLHSAGLSVQVNVAHAIANHLAALEFDLPLPGILLIDGFTSNIGNSGEDAKRRDKMYRYLIQLSERRGKWLQIVVADNFVPDFAQDFVRARFTKRDRLVPAVRRRS